MNAAPRRHSRIKDSRALFLFVFVLAALIGYAAAGLAGRLTGCLALTAAAVFGALTEIAGNKGLYMFHFEKPAFQII